MQGNKKLGKASSRSIVFNYNRLTKQVICVIAFLHLLLLAVVSLMRIKFLYSSGLDVSQLLINTSMSQSIDPYDISGRLTAPFYSAGYGPFFYACNFLFSLFTEDSVNGMRLLNTCYTVLLFLVFSFLVSTIFSMKKSECLVFSSIFTGLYSTTYLMARIRPDSQALLLFLTTIYFAFRALQVSRYQYCIFFMSLSLVLCIFTKQTFLLSSFIPFMLFLLFSRFDILWRAIAFSITIFILVWIILSHIFHHPNWIYPLLITGAGHIESSYIYSLRNLKNHLIWTGAFPLYISLFYIMTRLKRSDVFDLIYRDKNSMFIFSWFISSFLIAMLLSQMTASGVHYFGEFGAVSVLLLTVFYKYFYESRKVIFSFMILISLIGAFLGDIRLLRGELSALKTIQYQNEITGIIDSFTPKDLPISSFYSNIPLLVDRKIFFVDNSYYVNYIKYGFNIPEMYNKYNEYLNNKYFSCILINDDTVLNDTFLEKAGYFRVQTKAAFFAGGGAPFLYLRQDLFEKYNDQN